MTDLCLTLLCAPAVEEKLLDTLLMRAEGLVFTSTPTAAHGLASGSLSPAEQVMGRAQASTVQVIFRAEHKEQLLDALRSQLAGAGLRYWLTPVIEAGDIP